MVSGESIKRQGKDNEQMLTLHQSGSIRKRSLALGRNLSGSVGGYLPNSLAEMWEPSRDFAFLKLPSNGVSSVVAISNTMPQIMCVTSEGLFYSYNIDLESGGECTLMKRECEAATVREAQRWVLMPFSCRQSTRCSRERRIRVRRGQRWESSELWLFHFCTLIPTLCTPRESEEKVCLTLYYHMCSE